MLKTIDLFAGAGGMSLGFELTGKYMIVAAAENNSYAMETYMANHAGVKFEAIKDVRGYDFKALSEKIGGIDVVIGGPPCQGFSNANRQKNHIISQNNSLVKEYFRAVREIKPVAFVMENVSMLRSYTHRFYDTSKDHDDMVALGMPMRSEELVIADKNYDGMNCFEILSNRAESEYRLDENFLHMLNVLYKDRNNENRLNKFLKKNGKKLSDRINKHLSEGGCDFEIMHELLTSLDNIQKVKMLMDPLGGFIKFQKSFRLLDELDENEIIYQLCQDDDNGKITASVHSYSVIDYVRRILGNSYITKSDVVNSLWFGVPQDRKRFIMLGIRKDKWNGNLAFPLADDFSSVTHINVREAISDLTGYYTSTDPNDEVQPYHHNDDLTEYETLMREGSKGISCHLVPKTRELAQKRFQALSPGENFHKLNPDLKANFTNPDRTQNSIYQRLDPNKPSGTVTNVRKSMWIHPTIDRAVSVREAARLQSFPDRFIFKGTKNSQYQQVGNAVPPLMAKIIAEYVLQNLNLQSINNESI